MLTHRVIAEVVGRALDEDAPWGDLTSAYLIPEDAKATAELVAREAGVFSGGDVFAAAFTLTDPSIVVELLLADGAAFQERDVLARVHGNARGILGAERVGLNFVQRMSGIATLTFAYVARISGTGAHIADTRKTTPGLRAFERHAVRSGGARNHRQSLSDAVMAKDNHLTILQSGGRDLATELTRVRSELPHTAHLEVEVDRLDQIAAVLSAGPDTILLDNFSIADLRAGVALIAGRAIVDASGGINLNTVRDVAETGVDVISVGALTHSAPALDLGLDVTITTTTTTN